MLFLNKKGSYLLSNQFRGGHMGAGGEGGGPNFKAAPFAKGTLIKRHNF